MDSLPWDGIPNVSALVASSRSTNHWRKPAAFFVVDAHLKLPSMRL
jgi:hypothetical protein